MQTSPSAAAHPPSTFRNDIQGLRAIAVGAVVLYHSGVPFLPGGYVGVDVFFVISGFLITSHLLTGLQHSGKVRFASFYAKRARRILPASFLVLALSVVGALVFYPPLLMETVWQGAVATAFYVPNYLFAIQGTDYLAETVPSLFQHNWSLGIEEQFYLIWPALLAAAFFFLKSRRSIAVVVSVVVIASFGLCVWMTPLSQPWAFFGLPTRAWELGVGGLVALFLTSRARPLPPGPSSVTAWLGIAGIFVSVFLFNSNTAFPGYWAVVPVGSTALVILGGANAGFGPAPLLSLKPMVFIGTISYSLYLVHWPMLMLPQGAVGFQRPLPLWATLLLGFLSVPVAWVLYKYVENPARSAPLLVHARPRRTLLLSAAASVVVAVVATASFAYSNSRPLSEPETVAAAEWTARPAGTAFVPSNLSPGLRQAEDDQPAVYGDGCHQGFAGTEPKRCVFGNPDGPRVVLFGDSHAAQWFPALLALAEGAGYSLEVQTKSACPSVEVAILRGGDFYDNCSKWRDNVINDLEADPPDLVILANYGNVDFRTAGDSTTTWASGLKATLQDIDSPTVVIADTPFMGATPSLCLSAHLDATEACAMPTSDALHSSIRDAEVETAAAMSTPVVNVDGYLCNSEVCPPIIGNVLVYRDEHHLTATASLALEDALASELEETGLLPAKDSSGR